MKAIQHILLMFEHKIGLGRRRENCCWWFGPENVCTESEKDNMPAGTVTRDGVCLFPDPPYKNCYGVCRNYNRQDLCHTRMAKGQGKEPIVRGGAMWTTDAFGRWIRIN